MGKLIFLLILILSLLSCKPNADNSSFTAITWNAYLFFDSRSDGHEYSGFTQKDGYTDAVYTKRVKETTLMMARNFGDADLIILQEIESNIVLKDILDSGLKKKGFKYYGVASNGTTPISVGFISKYSPSNIKLHGIKERRLILELSFDLNGEIITVLALHATSRLDGGDDERFEEFSLLRSLADSNSGNLLLLSGDFNADPRIPEKGISNIKHIYSLTSPIVVTGDPGETGSGIYFSSAIDYMNDIGKGTYLYNGEWFFYDNILVSREGFDGIGWEYAYSEILRPYETIDLNGSPLKFDSSTGKGMSDHLPLKTVLRYH